MELTPSQPYLLRAIYEWIVDNELTPYLLVDASNDDVRVPQQYIEDGKIILNIAPRAVDNLELSNEAVNFSARFSGQSMNVYLPVQSVLAIYARENGQGIVFNESDNPTQPTDPDKPPAGDRPNLKIVK